MIATTRPQRYFLLFGLVLFCLWGVALIDFAVRGVDAGARNAFTRAVLTGSLYFIIRYLDKYSLAHPRLVNSLTIAAVLLGYAGLLLFFGWISWMFLL
jgi:hypothetical protein